MGAGTGVTFESLGEGGLILRWPRVQPSAGLTATIRAAWRRLAAIQSHGLLDIVPAPGSILLRFDPLLISREKLVATVRDSLEGSDSNQASIVPREPRRHTLSVFYGWRDGPDLREAADRLSLSPQEVIARHCAGSYTVASTGFAPGFVYLSGLDPSLHLERRAEPRRAVPAGSVAIGGPHTGIYGLRSPGGWWLIGRTSVRTFDVTRVPPTDIVLGDEVTFIPDPSGVTTEVHEAGSVPRGHRPWMEGV
jgi:KipI family sensor histidine kinase inhibitor